MYYYSHSSCSAFSSKPGHVRLGYMGHLTLISEDVIGALEHYPPDLKLLLAQYSPQPDWDEYVGGRYHETKVKDTSLLGGGKPVVMSGGARGATKWKVDEADMAAAPTSGANGVEMAGPTESSSEVKGEFTRTGRLTREQSADFGVAPIGHDEEEDNGPPQVTLLAFYALSQSFDDLCSLQATLLRPCQHILHPLMKALTKTTRTRTEAGWHRSSTLQTLLFQPEAIVPIEDH